MSQSKVDPLSRKSATDKTERLFAASISAYCSLTRPSRQEAAQLEDLTLPLYPSVSEETLRYAAAALSECALAPRRLVLELCGEPPHISAPLIVRTDVLSDADLISLLARRGIEHARIIQRRQKLSATVRWLIESMEANLAAAAEAAPEELSPTGSAADASAAPSPADKVRAQLRDMMRPRGKQAAFEPRPDAFPALRAAALSGNRDALAAALGSALGLDRDSADELLRPQESAMLATALRALALTGEQAFLIAACATPERFDTFIAVRSFIDGFSARKIGDARDVVGALLGEADAIQSTLAKSA